MMDAKKAKVVEAAQQVFFRYGFKRVTMGDLASAAGISRPALYLLFCNKEQVFQAVLRAFTSRALGQVQAGRGAQADPREQLRLAFEAWAVQPFQLLAASPDAKELIDCSFTFAKETIDQSSRAFEAELAAILAPLVAAAQVPAPAPDRIARILARAVHGFKETAASEADLRAMIDDLLAVVLAALR